jgi:uncharacterized membrane protein
MATRRTLLVGIQAHRLDFAFNSNRSINDSPVYNRNYAERLGCMIFLNPVWLLLAIPAAALLWMLKASSRLINIIRVIIMLLVLLALAQLGLKLPSRKGTVVIVADRSSSMPADSAQREKEAIDIIQSEMSGQDKLAVVSFGQSSAVEQAPQTGKFAGFAAEVGPDASNLQSAMRSALALIPQDSPGRILILSDGKWTGSNPVKAASNASARNIAVDHRLMERSTINDLAIWRIQSPDTVRPGQAYMIHTWIKCPVQQEVIYQLKSSDKIIAQGKKVMPAGLTRLTFRDRASASGGTLKYSFTVASDMKDPMPENNIAKMLVGVDGAKPLLCVTNKPGSGLAQLLKQSGMDISPRTPNMCDWQLEDLANYSAVILEDISADKIGTAAMENIAAWINDSAGGLMMTGGKNSYGPGGYFKSPLEPVMPISMELRKEHRKLSLAIVVALDRSGSMMAPVGGGKTKMDLANLATAQVLDMLSPFDEFGVIAVDSSAHKIVSLDSVEKNASYRNKILSIESMGGGIFVYEALSNAAAMLTKATPQTKHIILFADAADSEQPGGYVELLENCEKAGVTVSVIGLGKPTDVDAPLLEDIAQRGQGRCFFTDSPQELPRLFAQDTFVVARSSFLEEPTVVRSTPAMMTLLGKSYDITHNIGGYNLCYLRPNADIAAVSVDEYSAPIVAAWQYGIGRSLCYTPQANGSYTGQIADWQQLGDFYSSLARWIVGQRSKLGPDMLLTQQVQSGLCRITLHLDPDRKGTFGSDMPVVTTLIGKIGQIPKTSQKQMQYDGADTLTADIEMTGTQTYLSTVQLGESSITLAPVCLPYSPEFAPAGIGDRSESLSKLSRLTNGLERVNLAEIWQDLPRQPQIIPIAKWLIFTAIVLLLIEVLERRTGLVSRITLAKHLARARETLQTKIASSRKIKKVSVKTAQAKAAQKTFAEAVSQAEPETQETKKTARKKAPEETQPQAEFFGALSRAQKKASARIKRKK